MATVPLANPSLAIHIVDAAGQRQGRVVTQAVMIVEILVSQGQGEDALRHQGLHIVLDASGITIIDKGIRHTLRHVEKPVGLPQQQRTAVGCQPPSNPATIWRRPRPSNSNCCTVHCVVMGVASSVYISG